MEVARIALDVLGLAIAAYAFWLVLFRRDELRRRPGLVRVVGLLIGVVVAGQILVRALA